jgi:hypothetical protein
MRRGLKVQMRRRTQSPPFLSVGLAVIRCRHYTCRPIFNRFRANRGWSRVYPVSRRCNSAIGWNEREPMFTCNLNHKPGKALHAEVAAFEIE